MRRNLVALVLLSLLGLGASADFAMAQQGDAATISFGGLKGNPELPVTVTSQELTVNEAQATAIFVGEVLVVQGEMRLSAAEVRVEYDQEAAKISKLWAIGDVLLVNANDAAQAQTAEYDVASGIVTMEGDVALSQGAASFSAQRFIANITTGLGELQGGVTSTFAPSAVQKATE